MKFANYNVAFFSLIYYQLVYVKGSHTVLRSVGPAVNGK